MTPPVVRLTISRNTDPFVNLAWEEYLLRKRPDAEWNVFLYRDRPSVVIGRNQNPWTESAPECWNGMGAPVARRVSGGGTVVHDLGNANLTVIGPRRHYDPRRHILLLRDVLRAWGAPDADEDDRQSLFIDGRKISGSAFMLTARRALQHGTLLLRADLDRLRRWLVPGLSGVETHAQPSRRVPVMNLAERLPNAAWEHFRATVIRTVQAHFAETGACPAGGVKVEKMDPAAVPDLGEFLARYRSWKWRFGRTPEFSAPFALRTPHGTVSGRMIVRRGCIAGLEWMGDPEETAGAPRTVLEDFLPGRRFDPAAVTRMVRETLIAAGLQGGDAPAAGGDFVLGASGERPG